ncbi:MAG TPA: hypothetical protein VK590_15390 [Saprospiraceae bacterium]|nr:hypothetical protein [Saprospiraceae bacterium]
MKHLLKAFLLLGFMVFISDVSQAQLSLSSTKNPELKAAVQAGVSAYDLHSWDVNTVITQLSSARQALQGPVTQGTATLIELYKYNYYNNILVMLEYNIAPEVLVITSMERANLKAGGNMSLVDQQNIYKQTVQLF